jgi:phage head maturation protease
VRLERQSQSQHSRSQRTFETLSGSEVFALAIDNESWDGAAAMSYATNADDPAAAYAAICAGRRDGDPALQSTWALPHHRQPDFGPNADGVRNALSREPQTDGIDHDKAHSHLQDHMDEIHAAENRTEDVRTIEVDGPVEIRDAAKRELDMRLVPWDMAIDTVQGREQFARGAFDGIDPASVYLFGSEHEAHMALGQDGKPTLGRRPTGKAISLSNRADGGYGTFRVARTAAGDEQLALAADGIVAGASIEFSEIPGGSTTSMVNGRRTRTHNRVRLQGVTTTYRPAYAQAGVVAVRATSEGEAPVADQEKAAVEAAPNKDESDEIRVRSVHEQIAGFGDHLDEALMKVTDAFSERIGKLEEHARSQFVVPGMPEEKTKATLGQWAKYALGALSGDRISSSDAQYRALEDVITSDNLGVVPDTFLQNEMIGVIDARRPFMASTRRLPTPSSGTTMHVPVLEQRPTVGLQSEEKAEIDSTPIKVTTADFQAVTIAGGIDISLQLLKLSDPSFLDLAMRLMAEAFALTSEKYALQNLLGADVDDGNSLDPGAPGLGAAFITTFGQIKSPPDTIWLSSNAVGAFIDAVSPVTGLPMYSSITANATAGGGITGTVSGLRVVHVPALGNLGADVIVGPSSGFAWAEAGTFTLQVDVPSRAGRDVALVGIDWFAPYYPAAFTVYTLSA